LSVKETCGNPAQQISKQETNKQGSKQIKRTNRQNNQKIEARTPANRTQISNTAYRPTDQNSKIQAKKRKKQTDKQNKQTNKRTIKQTNKQTNKQKWNGIQWPKRQDKPKEPPKHKSMQPPAKTNPGNLHLKLFK
jgi:hypothetical protein